jgi:hypothetical protein
MGVSAAAEQQKTISQPGAGLLLGLFNRPIILCSLLVIATIALYYPVHTHPFVNFDDAAYVSDNAHVKSGLSLETVQWAFTTSEAANWHPLTWLSHAADCQFFGLNPAGHHVVNVLFHAVNAALLFWVLLLATGFAGRSFMVAALFAFHPVNVESVAWIAERKTVLSTMFFLLALGAYTYYARRPRLTRYALVALLFALGLMAKPQIIILPCILLLWDYWPLQRTSFDEDAIPATAASVPKAPGRRGLLWLCLEKVPLFILAAASAIITLHAQHGAKHWYPRLIRVGNGILSYALYIKNAIWPWRLAPLYPHPGTSLVWSQVFMAAAILLGITVAVLLGRRHGYLPVGWFWFLGALVPMLGIVQVGIQAMADRYAYISFIGLFIIMCWGVAELAQNMHATELALPVASLLVLLVVSAGARRQINYWRTPTVLWEHTIALTGRNWLAERQWGDALLKENRFEEAVPHLKKALVDAPNDTTCNLALAIDDIRHGSYANAIPRLQIVVKDKEQDAADLREAYVAMAKAYWELGDKEKSQQALDASRRITVP